jgi:hypothetical protein
MMLFTSAPLSESEVSVSSSCSVIRRDSPAESVSTVLTTVLS